MWKISSIHVASLEKENHSHYPAQSGSNISQKLHDQ